MNYSALNSQGIRGKKSAYYDNPLSVSSYKTQNKMYGPLNNMTNGKSVPVTSFPNGRMNTMLQNLYSSNMAPQLSNNSYSSSNYAGANNNYCDQTNGRQSYQTADLSSNGFNRSKSVYRDQDYARNGSSGSRSTASHSTGLPPAFKKNSSISADYGKNYQHITQNPARHQIINSNKIRMSSNSSGRTVPQNNLGGGALMNIQGKMQPSMKSSVRTNDRTWTLKGNNLNSDYNNKPERVDSKAELTYVNSNEGIRPGTNRLSSLNRPESSNRSSQTKLPTPTREESYVFGNDAIVIHVIDENKK